MALLLMSIMIIHTKSECIDSYLDHTISWITSNPDDASVIYLGNKANSGECQNSCQDLNYLCDKSQSDVTFADGATFSFDNTNCEVTIFADDGTIEPFVGITSSLASNKYRIDVELTIDSGQEAGFFFRSNNVHYGNNHRAYYFGLYVNNLIVTGYYNPNYVNIKQTSTSADYDTKYTLSVYVNGNSFTTYWQGTQAHKSATFFSSFTGTFAGLYSYGANVIFHTFKVDMIDGVGEKICAAFVYDDNGDCYGYYGTDFTTIEAALAWNINYESAIIYPNTCNPTLNPTKTPTDDPTLAPTKKPTSNPTKTPTLSPTKQPTTNPSEARNLAPTESPSSKPTSMPTARPTNPDASTCGDVVSGAYNGDPVTFIVNLPFEGDLTFDASSSDFAVEHIEAATSTNSLLAYDSDEDQMIRLNNRAAGDYKFTIYSNSVSSGVFSARIECISLNTTPSPSSNPLEPYSPTQHPTQRPTLPPTEVYTTGSPTKKPTNHTSSTSPLEPTTDEVSVSVTGTTDIYSGEYIQTDYMIWVTLHDCANTYCVEIVDEKVIQMITEILTNYCHEVDIQTHEIEEKTIVILTTITMEEDVELDVDQIAKYMEKEMKNEYGVIDVQISATDSDETNANQSGGKDLSQLQTVYFIIAGSVIVILACAVLCFGIYVRKRFGTNKKEEIIEIPMTKTHADKMPNDHNEGRISSNNIYNNTAATHTAAAVLHLHNRMPQQYRVKSVSNVIMDDEIVHEIDDMMKVTKSDNHEDFVLNGNHEAEDNDIITGIDAMHKETVDEYLPDEDNNCNVVNLEGDHDGWEMQLMGNEPGSPGMIGDDEFIVVDEDEEHQQTRGGNINNTRF